MVTTLKICSVDPHPMRTAAFVHAHLRGGLWCLLAAEYYPAGFLGVRIFRSHDVPSTYVLIEAWNSAESLETAKQSPAYVVLKRFQRNLTLSILDCGAFAVDHERDVADLAKPDDPAPVTTGCITPPALDPRDHSYSAVQTQTQ